jgi:hypothetical protein
MRRIGVGEELREFPMIRKGVEYTLATTATPGVWKWQFQIGNEVRTGKTETRINLLAMRRVQLRIDRELKARETELRSSTDIQAGG